MGSKIEGFVKYTKTTSEALETINNFTKIVLKYNEAFDRELDYSINIIDSDKDDYTCKVIFNLKTNEKK